MAPLTEEALDRITSDIYDGASEADREIWQSAYEQVSRLIGAGAGSVHFRYKADNNFEPIANTNPPGFVEDFNEIYFDLLPYKEAFLRLQAGGEFLRTRDCPDEIYLGSELYQDHFKRMGRYEILHFCLFEDDFVTGGVTFSRSEAAGVFTNEQRSAARRLLPHIQRAAELHLRVRRLRNTNHALREAWNRVNYPVILISSKRGVVFSNIAAERLLSDRNGFWFGRRGKIEATLPSDAKSIEALVSGVVKASSSDLGLGGSLNVARHEMQPLTLTVTPFREHDPTTMVGERFALLQVTDPERAAGSTEEELRATYGLTRAEARVARLLADGRSLVQICEVLEISQNTARTHLKRVYSKTGANRQSALVQLIIAGRRN